MTREDYEKIREQFSLFVTCWKEKNTEDLKKCFIPEVKCYMGTCKDSSDGGRHSRNGVEGFVKEVPKCSHIHMEIHNFVCRAYKDRARMSAIVTGAAAGQGEWRTCEFSFLFSNELIRTEETWKFSELRFDLTEARGDFQEFMEPWYQGDAKAHWFQGVHLPMISGELDSPWTCVPECECVLTEEEQIEEAFARYAFGIDTVSFQNLDEVFSENLVINMAPFGSMDKRTAMQTLKIHRQPDKYWIHPIKPESITIKGEEATARFYRMGGHRQRSNPLVLTPENIDHEFACARYEIKAKKEQGRWKLARMDYFLGLLDLGMYEEQK